MSRLSIIALRAGMAGVHLADRGYRPGAVSTAEAERAILEALQLVRARVGRGPRHRRAARAVPAERTVGDLSASTPRTAGEGRAFSASARRERLEDLRGRSARRTCRRDTTGSVWRIRHGRGRAARSGGGAVRRPAKGSGRGRRGRPRPARAARSSSIGRRRHAGAGEIGRHADVSPGQRRRRSPDGDHPRLPRRRVGLEAPKHLLLYEYFGWEPPKLMHLPLLRNPDQEQAEQTQEPDGHPVLPRDGLSARSAAELLACSPMRAREGEDELMDLAELVDGSRSSTSRSAARFSTCTSSIGSTAATCASASTRRRCSNASRAWALAATGSMRSPRWRSPASSVSAISAR